MLNPRRCSLRRTARLATAAALALLPLAIAAWPVPASAVSAASAPRWRVAPPGPAATPATAVPAGDEIVSGVGDTSGWHLYAASSGDGWRWRALATLQPGGYEDEQWIGEQCITGDGRFVVAIVAPWHANNTEAGMDAGALAYVVDAHSGQARPLAEGVSLAYFNPGCGAGGTVALTSYRGRDQLHTHVSVREAASGAEAANADVTGEITSAVPSSGGIVGAMGDGIVSLSGAQVTPLGHVHGQAFDLRANDAGGVDLLAASGTSSTIWRIASGQLKVVGRGPLSAVQLLAGRGGATMVAGATSLAGGSGLRVSNPSPGGRVTAASLDGGAFLSDVQPAAGPAFSGSGGQLVLRGSSGGVVATGDLPSPVPSRTTAVPTVPAPGHTAPRAAATTQSGTTSTMTAPTCAVPRLDIWNQVLQPNSAQIEWAIQQAVRGWLVSGNTPARPTAPGDYLVGDSQPLPQYYPSQDFPPPTIFDHAGVPVPPQVMRGILAQESNWDQASWHAAIGDGGDPLIASYYGSGNPSDPSDIDYANADCGYGVGQLTDIMRKGAISQAKQVAVATDYAENVAAAVQALVLKWNQLAERLPLAVTINNGDPKKLENWYAAIWAYNTGVHIGDPGNGLGWFNNPANPIYPANRHPFLHTWANSQPVQTYQDAASPQLWPYQEKVFGWMEVPLLDPSGHPRYTGTYNWGNDTGQFLNLPPAMTFCSTAINSCDPSNPSNPCPSLDSRCWWDAPVQWVDCTAGSGNACAPTTFIISSRTAPEPAATHLDPVCTGAGLPSSAVIVDDMSLVGNPAGDPGAAGPNPGNLDPNVVGCPVHPSWKSGGTFALTDGVGSTLEGQGTGGPVNDQDVASIDLHQLGVGFGGHTWFTHTRPPADAARVIIGTWTPDLPTSGAVYQLLVFVPDNGATSGHATYHVAGQLRTFDQGPYSNRWVSLGFYVLNSGDHVSLTSMTDSADSTRGSDLAFNALAFVPVPPGGYVALGDSYSSGEGAGPWDVGTNETFNGFPANSSGGDNGNLCHRSASAWPRQYAALTTTFGSQPVVHLACSGSNMSDVEHTVCHQTAPDGTVTYPCVSSAPTYTRSSSPNPDAAGTSFYGETNGTSQLDQLDVLKAMQQSGQAPRLVTVTLGGNDAGFFQVIQQCVVDVYAGLNTCHGDFTNPDGSDQISRRIAGLQQPLTDTIRDIHQAAPGAQVVLVGYPSIFKYDANQPGNKADCSIIFNSDRHWLIGLASQYDQMASRAASAAGVQYISQLDAFSGREMCTASPYVVAPTVRLPIPPPPVLDQWFHPNADGYQQLAQNVKRALPGIS